MTAINRLEMHVPLSGLRRQQLDGVWSLELFDSPDEVPVEALTGERPDAVKVSVPGNWTMQNLANAQGETFVDKPHYTNITMPFDGPPPRLPQRNPAGVYRRTVTIPKDWQNERSENNGHNGHNERSKHSEHNEHSENNNEYIEHNEHSERIVLHVAGAESVHAVYVNGQFVGYGTDSRLPSEYEIGGLLNKPVNDLAIVVIRYSAHSYIEDQDQWWMAGLHRSVWIESRATARIADIRMAADFDPQTATGTIAATAVVDPGNDPVVDPGTAPCSQCSLRWTLLDPAGVHAGPAIEMPTASQPLSCADTATSQPLNCCDTKTDTTHEPSKSQLHEHPQPLHCCDTESDSWQCEAQAHWKLESAQAWSAETPRLYTLIIELLGPDETVIHSETQRVGLRRVNVADRQLLVNGEAIRIFGVNRHDHHPDRGKAVTVEDMRDDLRLMRLHNINAVRTSHYPCDDAFYDLCDELGFYVVNEANIEGHAYEDSICDDDTYRDAFAERGARMVQRDRNHPCVIIWSLGNETGYGTNHDHLAGWIRSADPSRPLHYEPAIDRKGWQDGGEAATDIVCPMYPQIDAVRAYGESGAGRRPLIMCEYSHAMGNSNGSLADYWDVIEATPGLQGGFIWEWKDQALRQKLEGGSEHLAYGGQFDDTPNDGNFVADGLMSADLEAHPAMREVAWVHRPVAVAGDAQGLLIKNRRAFTDLADLRARWELLIDGELIEHGELAVPEVPANSSVILPLPHFAEPLPDPAGCDAHLTIRWETVHDDWFAAAGHLVAWDQIELNRSPTTTTQPDDTADLLPDDVADLFTPPDNQTQPSGLVGVAPAEGLVEPVLNLWRAPTDNDGFKLMPDFVCDGVAGGTALHDWLQAGLHNHASDDLVDHRVSVERDHNAVTYRHVVDVPAELAGLPRVGVIFELPKRFNRVRWYGRGPHENYPDRKRSAMIGIWEQEPDELPYLVAQEFGLRCDCRWIELIDPASNETLHIDILQPSRMHFSAVWHRPTDLYEAATQPDVRRRETLVVCLDAAHRGLGTASCGPDVLPRYQVKTGHHEFAYRTTVLQRGVTGQMAAK